MAKASKKPVERTKRGKYDEKLTIGDSFTDIMKAAGQHAGKNNAERRSKKKS